MAFLDFLCDNELAVLLLLGLVLIDILVGDFSRFFILFDLLREGAVLGQGFFELSALAFDLAVNGKRDDEVGNRRCQGDIVGLV